MASWRPSWASDDLLPIGLAEAEETELTSSRPRRPRRYLRAVHEKRRMARRLDAAHCRRRRAQRDSAGRDRRSNVPWLYSMWADQPTAFYVRWEATGHRLQHVGEMVSVRNRLGLSPF